MILIILKMKTNIMIQIVVLLVQKNMLTLKRKKKKPKKPKKSKKNIIKMIKIKVIYKKSMKMKHIYQDNHMNTVM